MPLYRNRNRNCEIDESDDDQDAPSQHRLSGTRRMASSINKVDFS
jgi:hypothetical protein